MPRWNDVGRGADSLAPTPALRAVHRALDTLRDATFTGVLIATYQGGVCVRVHWEGVGEALGVLPDDARWQVAHSRACQAVRVLSADLDTARVVVQLRRGVPVGTHLDSAP